ncbi:MAG: trigger factor [Rhodospirillales bacterium]|nr:MAG: trigger factor [Rhodospirillales bacterium]
MMQVTEIKAEGLARQFRIQVPAADIDKRVQNRLRELAGQVRLPGFRPGKVPVAVLQKRYGAAAHGEAVEQALDESSRNILSERGLRPAVQPKIDIVSATAGADLEFTLAVELLPEVAPPDYGAITLERPVAEPADAQVEETLGRIAETFKGSRPLTEDRAALPGDIVVVDYVGRVDGKEFEGGTAQRAEIELGAGRFIPGFEEQLIGSRPGEDRELTVTFPEAFPAKDLAGREAVFSVHIHELRESEPVLIDDSLAVKMGLDNVESLRKRVRETLVTRLSEASRMRVKRALLDRLAEMYDFDLPQGMVDREYESIIRQLAGEEDAAETADQADAHAHDHDHDHAHDHDHDHAHDHDHDHDHDHAHDHAHVHGDADPGHDPAHAGEAAAQPKLTPEQAAEYRSIAERRVRLGLVLAEIARTNNLQVTQEELSRAMVAEARRYPGQEQNVLKYMRENPAMAEALSGPILEEKVVDFIIEMATVTDKAVTPDELLKPEGDDAPPSSDQPKGQPAGTAEAGSASTEP